jgi:hypothetical protein
MAAGHVIPLSKIPEQFRSHAAIGQSFQHNAMDAANVKEVETAAFLNSHSVKLSNMRIKDLAQNGILKDGDKWIDAKTYPKIKVSGTKCSYSSIRLGEDKEAIVFFDPSGKAFNTITNSIPEDGYYHDNGLFVNKNTRAMMDYRKLVAEAVKNTPSMNKYFDRHSRDLSELWIYKEGDKWLSAEEQEREAVTDCALTLVKKDGYYRSGEYFIFNGDGPLVALISLESHGQFQKLSSFSIAGTYSVEQLLAWSGDFAKIMEHLDVNSGTTKDFLDSKLYQMGVRGPGKGVWYTLLDRKLFEAGGLTVWSHGAEVTVTDEKMGVIKVVKLTKTGYNVTATPHELSPEVNTKISNLLDKIHEKTIGKK